MSRRVIALMALFTALALAVFTAGAGASVPHRGAPAPEAAASGTILGDYAGPLIDTGTHIDIPATVDRLADAHVNTYAYLICFGAAQSQGQWDQLPDFLDAAAGAGINVWVYLCPPTESHDTDNNSTLMPYGWDYPAWAQHIAEL